MAAEYLDGEQTVHASDVFKNVADDLLIDNMVAASGSPVEVQYVAGSGRGLFVTQDIPTGSVIIAEQSVAWQMGMDENGELVAPGADTETLDAVLLQFAPYSCTKESATATVTRKTLVKEVFASNAFGVGAHADASAAGVYAQGSEMRALFPIIRMTNHSCLPNARAYQVPPEALEGGNNDDGVARPVYALEALRDLKAGEEVHISYVPPTTKKANRMSLLYARYGFACRCVRCEPAWDDTIVTRCPHCTAKAKAAAAEGQTSTAGAAQTMGRVYWKKSSCEDCGGAVDASNALSGSETADSDALFAALTAPGRPSELVKRLMEHPLLAPEDVRIFLTAVDLLPYLAPAPALQDKLGRFALEACKRMPFVQAEVYGLHVFEEGQ